MHGLLCINNINPIIMVLEAHSFPLQLWLETGLIGILTFILLIAALIILYFKNRKSEKGLL